MMMTTMIIMIITIITNKEKVAVLRFSRPSLSWTLTVVKIGGKLTALSRLTRRNFLGYLTISLPSRMHEFLLDVEQQKHCLL